jgi:hypothetical protein
MHKFLLFKYKQLINVEGHGKYEIEITNLVDARTN